ncbi:MAG: DMT family transporter [bacterium]|nr:DMT family transporter [bacterium]
MQSIAFYGIAVLAVFCYAFLSVVAKKMQVSIPPFAFIAITMMILMLLALSSSLVFERSFIITDLKMSQLAWLLLFGIINFAGFVLYLKALSGMPVGHYQVISILTPVIGSGLAFAFLGEVVSARFFIAIPVIFIGLLLALIK